MLRRLQKRIGIVKIFRAQGSKSRFRVEVAGPCEVLVAVIHCLELAAVNRTLAYVRRPMARHSAIK